MRKFLLAVIAVMLMVPVFAQDELEATLGTDLVSGYIWRGQKLGSVSLWKRSTPNLRQASIMT